MRDLGLSAAPRSVFFSGVVLGGPHLHSWSPSLLASVVVGATALGALLGYFAVMIVAGSLVRGDAGSMVDSATGDGLVNSLDAVAHEHHDVIDHHDGTNAGVGE